MNCPSCGNQILSGEAFCSQCAAPVGSIVPLAPETAQLCPSCSTNNPLASKGCRICGTELQRLLGQGKQIRGYRIERVLGCGGFSAVYQTIKAGSTYAIKEIPIRDASAQHLFDFEAKIMASFSHPNLPEFFEHFSVVDTRGNITEQRNYIVMESIEGETLDARIQAAVAHNTFLKESEVLSWGVKLCELLEELHQHAIVHRDVKPENVKITPEGELKLIDFGIAKVYNPLNLKTRTSAHGFGSQGYAPPEQYTGKTDARSDIYALGATMYHLLTNVRPVDSSMRAAQIQKLEPIRKLNPKISKELEQAILKAMSLKTDARYPSMRDFKEALSGHVKQQLFECPRCRVMNDPAAGACVSCGTQFGQLETFVMRSGETVVGIENFARMCDAHWADAVHHLQNGDFEAWLAAQGRGDLKAVMEKCKRQEKDPNFALELFLQKAKLVKARHKPFKLSNGAVVRRLADLADVCDQHWDVLRKHFHSRDMERWLLTWARQDLIELQTEIKQQVKDQDIALEMFLEKAGVVKRPRLNATLEEDWGAIPLGTVEAKTITLENRSRGRLYGELRLLTDLPGLTLEREGFQGNRNQIQIRLDTSQCKAKKTYRAIVQIQSNGGTVELPIRFRVEHPWTELILSTGMWAGIIGVLTTVLRLGLYGIGYNRYFGWSNIPFWHIKRLMSLPVPVFLIVGGISALALIVALSKIAQKIRWYFIIPLTIVSWAGLSGGLIWGGINGYYGVIWILQRIGVGIEWGDAAWQLLSPWALTGAAVGIGVGIYRKAGTYGQWWFVPLSILLPVAELISLMHIGQGDYTLKLISALIRLWGEA
ncbi:MAG: serine/threonine protein kinase [Candidatus Poribacteria bacterium]|nr:serine/threonine protein kinase [Candidatus Poribacteria bacterium]